MKNLMRSTLVVASLLITLAGISNAQVSKTSEAFPNVKIKNFGQMDENYFRGGQPKKDQYGQLKDLGITTIIDLRNDPEEYEKTTAESLGMK